jgi:DNA-binding NarL/FixJ family response regulator
MSDVPIVLVDDHRVVTRSLKAWFESFPGLKVVGIASSGEALLARLDDWRPQIVLQDLLLPGGLDGIETARRVLAAKATRLSIPALFLYAAGERYTAALNWL